MQNDTTHKDERIGKLLARAGICSRREAENYIRAGRVHIGGQLVSDCAHKASRQSDITVDGKKLHFAPTQLWGFHKPAGFLTTRFDDRGRACIFDVPALAKLEQTSGTLITVGRLDMNSEGLLLLSNDGELSGFLEKSDYERVYRVRAFGKPDLEKLKRVEAGQAVIEGIRYGKAKISWQQQAQKGSKNQWLQVTLTEGKNREVRNLLRFCGMRVNRLIRIGFGAVRLGDLPQGEVQALEGTLLANMLQDFSKKAKPNRSGAPNRLGNN